MGWAPDSKTQTIEDMPACKSPPLGAACRLYSGVPAQNAGRTEPAGSLYKQLGTGQQQNAVGSPFGSPPLLVSRAPWPRTVVLQRCCTAVFHTTSQCLIRLPLRKPNSPTLLLENAHLPLIDTCITIQSVSRGVTI